MKYSHPVRGKSAGQRAPITKWEEQGQVAEGEWRGTRPGKYGDLGIVLGEDGAEVVFPMHTVLVNKLASIRVGAGISILYKGKAEGKSGTSYKDFDVFTEGPEALQQSEPEGESDGDEVPF